MDSFSKSFVNFDFKFLDRDCVLSIFDFNGNTKDLMFKCEDKEWDVGFFSYFIFADFMSVDESDDLNSLEEEFNSLIYYTDLNGEMVLLNKDEFFDIFFYFYFCEVNLIYIVLISVNANFNEFVDFF